MAMSRRPARFKRPDFKQTNVISQEKLEMLRAAAARVYINEQNPSDKSSVQEVNTIAAGPANVKEEVDFDNGMQLLAAAATKIRKEKKE